MKKFEHGGDIEAFAKELKCNTSDIIDLSSNINFIKSKLKKDFNTLEISSYPKYEKLYKKIANNYKVKSSQIELFNGGSSAIFTLFRHLGLNECNIYSPAYLEYKKAATLFSYKLNLINRFENMQEKVKKNSLVIFVNPSTPDGRFYDIEKLMKSWMKKNCTIFIDESFLDFTSKESCIKYLKNYDKLYILKSMTKFYSSAGIRIGTIISSAKNISALKEKEPMWKLSTFDMNYLLEVLGNKNFINKTKKETNQNSKKLKKLLKSYEFIKKVYKSDANYFLVQLKKIDAKTLQEHLKTYKIMIRDCSNFDYLDSSYVRIAVKDKASIKALKKALDVL